MRTSASSIEPEPGRCGPGSRSFFAYLRWQQAALLWQQDDPLQHPLLDDFAKELPNVNITRAARLKTPIISFFISILLINLPEIANKMTLVTQYGLPRQKATCDGLFFRSGVLAPADTSLPNPAV